jgi:hypothetical protein
MPSKISKWDLSACRIFLFIALFLGILTSSHVSYAQIKKNEMVSMRDGVKLHTEIVLPITDNGPWPVALLRTPYKLGSNPIEKEVGPAVALGVVLVVQYMRGRFLSEGEDTIFGNAKEDGADTVAWILKQPWSNGKITTVGPSALGIHQYLMAETTPQLTSQLVLVAGPDLFHHVVSWGGVFRKSLVEGWLEGQAKSNNMPLPHPILKDIGSRGMSSDPFWQTRRVNDWSKVKIPAIHLGGWYDCFSKGTIDAYINYTTKADPAVRHDQKLIMGPWTHSGIIDNKQGELRYPNNAKDVADISLQNLLVSWVQAYVKDQPGHLRDILAPVSLYVMGDVIDPNAPGNKWYRAHQWPLADAKYVPYYMHADKSLSPQPPTQAESFQTYKFDPANPVPTKGGLNLQIPAGPRDQTAIENRPDVLLFTSELLSEPIAVVGRISADLWVSTDAKDTDFTVKITDVYPDGRSMLVLDGILRLRHRNTDAKEEFLPQNTVTKITVDLWSTAIIFNKGHRIRVAISSSNYPRFQVNPNNGQPFSLTPDNFVVANNTLYHQSDRASAINLPIISLADLERASQPHAEHVAEYIAEYIAEITDPDAGISESPSSEPISDATTDEYSSAESIAPEQTPTEPSEYTDADNTEKAHISDSLPTDNSTSGKSGCNCNANSLTTGHWEIIFILFWLCFIGLRWRLRHKNLDA